jgi:EH domain-containing protein 1
MDVVTLEQWFKAADEDRDGVIKGAEAVRFFQRSGLAQDVLGQVRSQGDVHSTLSML